MYFYGLGEFFYTNGIEVDEEGFMEIKSSPSPFLEKEGDVSRNKFPLFFKEGVKR
jgi:hypothetical protein